MRDSTNMALKEWAVTCRALKEGRQILLFRKGGISEEWGEFTVEEDEFFLYPTYLHQNRDAIKEEYRPTLREEEESPVGRDLVRLDSYAVVEQVLKVHDLESLRQLESEHIWTDDFVVMRFNYRPKDPLYVMLLRVYLLPAPIDIEERIEYLGCKSWVPTDSVHSTTGAIPVLSEADFAARMATVRDALAGAALA